MVKMVRNLPFSRFILAALCLMALAGFEARGQNLNEIEARRADSRAEFERVSREAVLSEERLKALANEVDAVKKDSANITAALIQAAKTEKKLGQEIEDITDRLLGLKAQEADIRRSLTARRDVLAEVLGALQRMGLNPPPALLVKPEDALGSVRSAILLGAVVPELRSETEVLIADLNELGRLVGSIESERDRLAETVRQQADEKARLDLLLAEKSRLAEQSEAELAREREKSAELAGKADSLRDLIAALEREIEDARSAAEKARRAEEEKRKREEALAALAIPESNRLVQSQPFSKLRRKIALPVAGRLTKRFGSKDDNGAVMMGDTVATQSGAIVTAPADGSVLYAGPFRSYGQLLILNAGDGYHVVLAGMGRINVALGQSVLAGEPVGAMKDARVASTSAIGSENPGPELYIEFRKDGRPVDPAPWWADRISGRTGNDS